MKCDRHTFSLYAVTDRMWTGRQSLYEQVESALKGGVTCVQLREKTLNDGEFLQEALQIADLCKNYDVPFLINDNIEIAVKCNADGVHIGQEDMTLKEARPLLGENKIIGVSVHNVSEALAAVKDGADYLGVGAMFSTSTKTDTAVLSLQTLKDICKAVNIPVVAIGGINKKNITQLKDSGIDGVALVSAVFGAEDIEKECRFLSDIVQEWKSY